MSIIDLAYTLTAPVEAAMFFMMFDAFLRNEGLLPFGSMYLAFASWRSYLELLIFLLCLEYAMRFL